MPTINPDLVPTITPGNLFTRLTTDSTLNVQWITATDPVYWSVMNRPLADIVLRQLIIAKAVDDIELRLSHQARFPFLITAKVDAGSAGELDLPGSWIWDMHVSLPAKWEYLRLARIKRISGTNTAGTDSDEVTGILRFVFSAQVSGSATEVYLFSVDYQIDSFFTYQIKPIQIVTTLEETNPIDSGEALTVSGTVVFRTLDRSDTNYSTFLKALAPTADTTDSNSDGIFDTPAIYDILATPPGGISQEDDFLAGALNHGTGVTVASASNSIPSTDSDVKTWITAMNYPYRIGATRVSIQGITIPSALFNEFSLVVPAFDEETGDTSLQNHPVWVNRIERLDDLANQIKFYFSTHSINPDGTPEIVEFASLCLSRTFTSGRVVNIDPTDNLLEAVGTDKANFYQGFGLGHVVLSSLWGATTDEVVDFFDGFKALLDSPAVASFVQASSVLSSYSLNRSSPYTPTKGQFEALVGSTARWDVPQNPSDTNRVVMEADQGLGNAVDFRTLAGFPDELRENDNIEPIAYTGSLVHRCVKLIVDSAGEDHDYETDILPRLRCLFGRDPIFGDFWHNGTNLCFFNGDAWQTI
jgi:hypothetical protein